MTEEIGAWIIAFHDMHCRRWQVTACYWVSVGCLVAAWWVQFGR